MAQHQTIGFVTDKAPGRGYKLSKIVSLADGLQAEVIAYRTTLPEIQAIEHSMKEQLFGEAAWYAPGPMAPVFADQHRAPQPQPEAGMPDDGSLPEVVHSWHEQSLMDRIGGNSVRALVPALFVWAVWLSMNLRVV